MDISLKFIAAMIITVGLVSCASLSKNECLQADWFELGYRDGSMGRSRAIFQKHYDACLDHSVRADRQAYYKGRDEGLKVFCTEQSGFNKGRAGRSYSYVCPPALEPDFLAGYEKGRALHKYESKVSSLEKRLVTIEKQIQDKEKQLYADELGKKKRDQIRSDLKYLDLEYRAIVRELKLLEKMRPVALYQ